MEKDEIFKIMLSNSVTLHQGKPYCYKCSIHTENWNNSLLHIESEEHVLLVKDYKGLCSTKLGHFSAKRSRRWVESGIVINTIKEVKCILCSCTLSPLDDLYHIEQHISGKFHTTALSVSKLRDRSLFAVENSVLNYSQVLMANKLKVTSSSYLICIACLCTLSSNEVLPHIKAKRHKKKIQLVELDQKLLTAKLTKHDTNHNIIGDNETAQIKTLQENDTIDKYLNHGIVQGETEYFNCSICLCSGMLLDKALQHIRESHHATALKNSVLIERNEVSAATETLHNREPSGLTIETAVPRDAIKNVARAQWFKKEGIIVGDFNTVICTVCFRPLPSPFHDIQHLKGRRHSNALKAIKTADIISLSSAETDFEQDTNNDQLTTKHKSCNQDKTESDTSIHGSAQQIMQHSVISHLSHSYTINHHISTYNSTDCLAKRNGRHCDKSADTEMTVPQCYSYNQSCQAKHTLGHIVGIRCLCCNKILHSRDSVRDHFSNNKHEENIKRLLKSIAKTHFRSSKYSVLTNANTFAEYEAFPLSTLILPGSADRPLFEKEITSVTINVRWKNISDTSITNGITGFQFTCNVCYVKLSNSLDLIEHLCGRKQTETGQAKSESCPKNELDNLLTDALNRLSINNEKEKEDKTKELVAQRRREWGEWNRENGRQKEDKLREFVIPSNICARILHEIKAASAVTRLSPNTYVDDLVPESECSSTLTSDFITVDSKMYNFDILQHGCIIRRGLAYYCTICKTTILNDKQNLVQHIFYCNKKIAFAKNLNHSSKELTKEDESSRIGLIFELESYMSKWYWYSIDRFCCIMCCLSFTNKSKFVSHILRRHFAQINFDRLIFEGCMSCSTLWISPMALLNVHETHPTHLYLKESKLFYVEALPAPARQLLTDTEVAVDELYELSEKVLISNLSSLVSYTQYKLKASLESFLKITLGLLENHVKVYFYGPRSNGLTYSESNLYIVYELVGGNAIEDIIEAHANDWFMMPKSGKGQQIRHKKISMICDIRSTGDADIRKSEILRLLCNRYQPCRRLILFIKKWVSYCSLPGRYKISEEALTWLVIFALQENSYLPSVRLHQAKSQASNKDSVSFRTIQYLLVEFFTFYIDFDYRQYVISPFMGRKIKKEDFSKTDTLPEEMQQYFKEHITTGTSQCYLDIRSSLCLQDPVDLSSNLTKNVQSVTLKHFREYCKKSRDNLISGY